MIGVVLAGGQASRMGGIAKGSLQVGGRSLFERVLTTLRAQCADVIVSANENHAFFESFGCLVVADETSERKGPLAGVLAALDTIAGRFSSDRFVVTAPIDAPFVPLDLVARLQDEAVRDHSLIACARSGGRVHPTSALWSVDLRHDLRTALDDNIRKMQVFFARHPLVYAEWPVVPFDPFFNVNTPDDLARAQHLEGLEHDAQGSLAVSPARPL